MCDFVSVASRIVDKFCTYLKMSIFADEIRTFRSNSFSTRKQTLVRFFFINAAASAVAVLAAVGFIIARRRSPSFINALRASHVYYLIYLW